MPFAMSYTGVGYRKDKVVIEDPSWNIFGRTDLKGRMTMLNDIREALGAALIYLGFSANSLNEEEVNQAADQLIAWKKILLNLKVNKISMGLPAPNMLLFKGIMVICSK
ncbi:MAG: hypothetical protein HWD61_00690 [Parachlamydiaceae bacterium]|nr:MAG: hypothetical protein HWD61_00690 [Parachlamydiaceae bacterium]